MSRHIGAGQCCGTVSIVQWLGSACAAIVASVMSALATGLSGAALVGAAHFSVPGAHAGQEPAIVGFFDFNESLVSECFDGISLEVVGGGEIGFGIETIAGSTTGVWSWLPGTGLRLGVAELGLGGSWSVGMAFRLDAVTGYRKVLDTQNLLLDSGWYNYSGTNALGFWPNDSGSQLFGASQFVDVVITHDGTTTRGYVNGLLSATVANAQGAISVHQLLHFFIDDIVTGGNEAAGGAVGRLIVWDAALDAALMPLLGPLVAIPSPCVVDPVPDLRADEILAPAFAALGEQAEVSWSASNIGSAPADSPWVDRIYLSPMPDGSDAVEVATITIDEVVGPGESYSRVAPVTIPPVVPGDYWFVVVVDANGDVDEGAHLTNNTSVSAEATLIGGVDLAMVSVTAPSGGTVGQPFELEWVVSNQGLVEAQGPWSDQAFISTTKIFDSSAVPLGAPVPSPNSLRPGGQYEREIVVTWPSRPGEYWMFLVTDSDESVADYDRSNNLSEAVGPITVLPPFPDLRVDVVTIPASAPVGAKVAVDWTVTNHGTLLASGLWTDRVSISLNDSIGDDVALAEFAFEGALAPGESYSRSEVVQLPPTAVGDRWFVVETDAANVIDEGPNEGNNTSISRSSLQILAPDLVVQSISAPSSAQFGEQVSVTWTVANIGTADATGVWQDRVFLSTTPTLGSGAVQLFAQTIVGESPLAPDGSYQRTALVTIPLSQASVPGVRYLIAQTDALNQVIELDETNNSLASDPIEVTLPPLPNLIVSAVGTPPSGPVGAAIEVSWTVTNTGDAPATGPWIDSVFASADDQIGGDTLLATRIFEGVLGPGESTVRTANVLVPNLSGEQYYLVVCTDSSSAVIESNPSDNCAVSDSPGSILRADLVVSNVSAPASAEGDTSITVSWTLQNAGLATAFPVWIEGVYIDAVDAEGVPAGAPQLLGTTVVVAPLFAGASVPRSATVTIPGTLAEGSYRILVRTDITNVVSETGPPENNESYAIGVTEIIQPPRPNLVVTNISTPRNGLVGQSLIVSYTAANIGAGTADGAWTDRVWAVNESTGQEVILGNTTPSGPLLPGLSYTKQVTSTYPLTPGTYRIKVQLDRTNAVNEGLDGGEDDNIAFGDGTFLSDTYIVTVSTPLTEGVPPLSVPLSGTATLASTGDPVPNATVAVAVDVQGTTRIVSATTNDDGGYEATFTPLPNEAGQYALRAGPPGNVTPTVQDAFVLYGMRTQPATRNVTVFPKLESATGSISLINNGDVPLTGLEATFTAEGAPRGLDVDIELSSQTLNALGTVQVNYVISATGEDFGVYPVTLQLSSAQGATATATLNVSIQPPSAQLVVQPGSLNASMAVPEPGSSIQTIVEFTVKNIGAGEATGVQVQIPAAPWLGLGVPSNLGTIAPGASKQVVLVLSPAPSLPLGPYTGSLVVSGSSNSVTVPFAFNAVSEELGTLVVTATNEGTYWNPPDFPKVSGATVTVRDAFTNAVVATGTTAGEGTASFELPKAYYKVTVTAPSHGAFNATILLPGSQELAIEAFMPFNAVTWAWTVVPTTIDDEYTITLQAVFNTSVPAPIVTIEPASIDLNDYVGKTTQIDFTIANEGFIAIQDLVLNIGSHPRFVLTPLATEFGDLGAGQSLVVPVLIEDAFVDGGVASGSGSGCASLGIAAGYTVLCGDLVVAYARPVIVWNLLECGGTSPSGIGNPFGGIFGGGTGGDVQVNPPFVFEMPQEDCDSCRVKCVLSLVKCSPLGIVIDIGECVVEAAAAPDGLRSSRAQAKCAGTLVDEGGTSLPPFRRIKPLLGRITCVCESIRDCALGCAGVPCSPGQVVEDVLGGGSGGSGGGGGLAAAAVAYGDIALLAEYLLMLETALRQLAPIAYLLGDTRWLVINDDELVDGDDLGLFLETFALAAGDDTPGGLRLDRSEIGGLAAALPSHLDLSDLDTFVSRWNQAVEAFEAGDAGVAGAPQGGSLGSFVESEFLALLAEALQGNQFALDAGYESLTEGWAATSDAYLASIATETEGICASVTIQLTQNVVIARDAFEATLTLNNQNAESPLEDILIQVDIRDENGQSANHLFEFLGRNLSNINAVDGTGFLPAGQSGSSQWILVPFHAAAPDGPTNYFVSGLLQYSLDGNVTSIPLFPVPIVVFPNADLDLKYYLERRVYGNDPFTSPEVTEPSVPFTLGLIVSNKGGGAANNFRITTSQPTIIENELGLLIDFQLISAQIGDVEVPPSLQLNFGDIEPDETAVALWLLTSSLQGEFIEFNATFENINGLGAPGLSLIDTVETFFSLHAVRADVPNDDGLPDFLVLPPFGGSIPVSVHFSDGTTAPVSTILDAVVDGTVTPRNLSVDLSTELGDEWTYIRIEDPTDGEFSLVSVTRSDGKQLLVGPNAWQTRAILNPIQNQQPAYLHLFDRIPIGGAPGAYTYTLNFEPISGDPSEATGWSVAATHGNGVGEIALPIDPSGSTVEHRASGIETVRVDFTAPVNPATWSAGNIVVVGLTLDDELVDLSGVTVTTGVLANGTVGTITFTPPLPDKARYCIAVTDVTDTFGQPLQGQTVVSLTALRGDATGDRRVNNTDVAAVMSLIGVDPIDPSMPKHVRSDIDLDGKVTAADVQLILASVGTDLRFVDDPCVVDLAAPDALAATGGGDVRRPDRVPSLTGVAGTTDGVRTPTSAFRPSRDDGGSGTGDSAAATHRDPIALVLNEPWRGVPSPDGTVFTVRVDRPETVHIEFAHDAAFAWTALELFHDGASIAASALPATSTQRIELARLEPGVYTVVATAQGGGGLGGGLPATLVATALPFGVSHVATSELGRGEVTVVAHGARLFDLSRLTLRTPDGARTIAPMSANLAPDGTAWATFDLAAESSESLDLVATPRMGAESILRNAITLAEPSPDPADLADAALSTHVALPAAMSPGSHATATVTLRNTGNVDLTDRVMTLTVPTGASVESVVRSIGHGVVVADATAGGTMEIQIDRLPAGATHAIAIDLAIGSSFTSNALAIAIDGQPSTIPVQSALAPLAIVSGEVDPDADVDEAAPAPYRITATRDANADGHAIEARLELILDEDVDLSTLRIRGLAIGGERVVLAHDGWRHATTHQPSTTPRTTIGVRTEVDPSTRTLTLIATAIDPATGDRVTPPWPDLPSHVDTPLAKLAFEIAIVFTSSTGDPIEVQARWVGGGR